MQSSEFKLERLNNEIKSIEKRQKKKRTSKSESLELSLARRRVALATNRLASIRSRTAVQCDDEIRRLNAELIQLTNQMNAVKTRVAYWEKAKNNHDQFISEAIADLDRVTKYYDSMKSSQDKPTVEEVRAASVAKLKALQETFKGTGATLQDLQNYAT